ncbi:MAG TPA: hypothetical protein VGI16_00125 [Candidatus Acidoferrum sp.]|jgi:hypothetical protein
MKIKFSHQQTQASPATAQAVPLAAQIPLVVAQLPSPAASASTSGITAHSARCHSEGCAVRSPKNLKVNTTSPRPAHHAFLAALLLPLALTGCAVRQTHVNAFPWAAATTVRPRIPQLVPGHSAPEAAPEEIVFEVAAAPEPIAIVRAVPPRPRVANPPAARGTAAEPGPVQIAPSLTEEEAAAAKQKTTQDLATAEKNLAATNGKTLNPTQLDLASKIRSFLAEARDASAKGDWSRASNAANKAQVLSDQLARSL